MELIYILTLEVLGVVALFKIFSNWVLLSIVLLINLGIWLFTKRREYLIYLTSLLLVGRIILSVDSGEYNELVKLEIELDRGRGKIVKIDNRYPRERCYTYISELADGKYEIIGEILEVEEREYGNIFNINILEGKKIEKNFLEGYFDKKVKEITTRGDSNFKHIYRAVVLGEGSEIGRELREKFNYTGTSHLMALSGLHIGIILGGIGFILSRLPIRREGRYILMLIALTIYFLGVKQSPSLIRAYIMAVVFIGGKVFYENTELIKSLAVSFIITIFLNPTMIDEISFKLSYLAVFAIGGVYPLVVKKIYRGKSKFIRNFVLVSVIQIFLTPIIMKEFGSVQFLSLFTNLLILPLGAMYITGAFILLFLSNLRVEGIIFPVVEILFKIFIKSMKIFSNIPYLTLNYRGDRESILFLLFYVIIFGMVFYNKKKRDGRKNEKIYRRTKILK